ncbi:serine/threonine-protein kinase [Occultella aeris]|uniref:non-specific serine/threonine protein kinase n=1 Tax=Occultella aeris TaxID=2761496 RepID=A0A7M4DGA5_9MICO|nr:serine/threonine-protein kinase [Occultella aeris]VZO35948.1 Serine/threonine-protein kinase PknB [Occultella aeris]
MSSAAPGPIGSVIADRYEVLDSLGSGQHGEVWHVHDSNLDANYALKLLGSNQIAGPWAEARLLNSLSGDYILPIRNADTTPEGTRYLVTDVAEHGTVMDRIDTTLGVAEEQAVSWVREACNGLARVHRHGLLHRDVKPENLFLTYSAKCLVGDFSLAGVQNASGCVAAGGTLATMAPEVGAVALPGYAGDVEVYCVRSEVFSLGATLYWLLAGTPPVTGTRHQDAATASPADLWELAPHVSRGTRDIVMKALSKDPAGRYSDPAALAAALGRRNRPDRRWVRVAAHRDHERCYEGVKAGRIVDLCVISKTGSSEYVLHVRHKGSGRRLARDGMSATSAGLNRAIRSAIRAIG